MITLKRSDFLSDEAFLAEIKKYEGASAQAYLNEGWQVHIAGFAFGTCNGCLAFKKLKSDDPMLVRFGLPHCLGVRTLVSYFHTIEIDVPIPK